jgi:hypothetical protein
MMGMGPGRVVKRGGLWEAKTGGWASVDNGGSLSGKFLVLHLFCAGSPQHTPCVLLQQTVRISLSLPPSACVGGCVYTDLGR